MVPDRKARLLFVSSQASPPSSQVSFQKPTANLTESMVSRLFKTTVLPSASTSFPPHDHKYGSHQPGASPNVWPAVWPGSATRLSTGRLRPVSPRPQRPPAPPG